LEKRYGETNFDNDTWICAYCRNICSCASCRKKKTNSSSNTKMDTRRGKKRNTKSISRGDGKRRKFESHTTESITSDSDEYEGDAETTTVVPKSDNRSRGVTLKDLIDAGFLIEGETVHFKKSQEFSGTLLSDGQILCGDRIASTVSTFARFAANELKLTGSRQNGWRLAYCRSKCLLDLRKEYLDSLASPISEAPVRYEVEEDAPELEVVHSPEPEATVAEGEDDEVDEESEEQPLPPQVAAHYHWLKYELERSPEYVHWAPSFDTHAPFDSVTVEREEFHFDIVDEDFFPNCCWDL